MIKIEKQDRSITRKANEGDKLIFTSKNGFRIMSSFFPSFAKLSSIFFIRGSNIKYDNEVVIINDKSEFDNIVEAVNEFNEYTNSVDYIKLHEELWVGVADGKDKSELCLKISEKYNLKTQIAHDCFLCEESKRNDMSMVDCINCKGQWFPNTKGSCLLPGSYYLLWRNETDPELKRALALKISRCANN